jgi:hypothetical protein
MHAFYNNIYIYGEFFELLSIINTIYTTIILVVEVLRVQTTYIPCNSCVILHWIVSCGLPLY